MEFLKRKKMIFFIIFSFCLIFLIFYYKNNFLGNNIISKGKEDIIAYVEKKFNHYKANISITINSNKNTTVYEAVQEVDEEKSVQTMLKPEEVQGVTIERKGNILKILNSKLKLEKMYQNYQDCFNNSLYLNVFAKELKNCKSDINEKEGELIIEIESKEENNTYTKYKKLVIDSQTLKPKKLEIKDKNQKTTICILYNDIEIK